MQKIAPFQARAMLLSVVLVLLLAACGDPTPQPTPAGVNPTTDAIPAPTTTTPPLPNPTTDAIPAPTATTRLLPPTPEPTNTTSPRALDLSSLDVCTFVPRETLEGIIGPLKDEGTQDTVLGKEEGCTFYNEEGNFADIRIYPPDSWELQKNLQTGLIELHDLGSEGFVVNKSDAYEVWVLTRDVAVIQVRVSNHNGGQARQIAEAVLDLLP